MKTFIIITIMATLTTTSFAAPGFNDKTIRQNNDAIRKSIQKQDKRRELNSIESEMNRIRGNQDPANSRQMKQYESQSIDLQREINK